MFQPALQQCRGRLAVYFYEPERWELYELARDLGEEHDLAAREPARLRALGDELVQRLAALEAPLPLEGATGLERAPRSPAP